MSHHKRPNGNERKCRIALVSVWAAARALGNKQCDAEEAEGPAGSERRPAGHRRRCAPSRGDGGDCPRQTHCHRWAQGRPGAWRRRRTAGGGGPTARRRTSGRTGEGRRRESASVWGTVGGWAVGVGPRTALNVLQRQSRRLETLFKGCSRLFEE